MRHKRLKLSAVLMLVLGLTGLQAQTLYVKQSNGTQTAYALNSVKKMTFSTGNLTITKTDNSNGVYAVSDLRYLNFSNNSTGLKPPQTGQSQMLKVYPNPVGAILNIDLSGMAETKGTLSILNFEGKTLLSQQVNTEELHLLDISHLPTGIYLCRFSNATEIKTVEIIKK